jgi:hypothetical protein
MEISARWEDYEIDRRLSEFGTSLAAEVEVTVLCLISFLSYCQKRRTPLHLACLMGHVEGVRALLAAQAEVASQDSVSPLDD